MDLANNNINFDEILKKVKEIKQIDPLRAIYIIDEELKNVISENDIADLNALRDNVIFQIKKNNLIAKTSLDTLTLINLLKNKKMDYAFMVMYNELKARENLAKYAKDFQYFFDEINFDSAGFQTLIYDLLVLKDIDFNYKVNGEIINPKKMGSFLKNEGVNKMQEKILNLFEKDISKIKIARQVFSAYLFQNWIDILLNRTSNDYEQIFNVVQVLYGEKSSKDLTEKERKLYNVFK